MTTAEKLAKIAENAPKVYNVGQENGYNSGYHVGAESNVVRDIKRGLNAKSDVKTQNLTFEVTLNDSSIEITGIGTATDTDIVLYGKTISKNAFKDCDHITSLVIPSTITNIGASAFEGCTALETIYLNANLPKFTKDTMPFKYCGMNAENGTTIIIGKDVTKIPQYLFYGWTENNVLKYNITRLIFEKGSVCSVIDARAFYSCFTLKYIEIPDSVEIISAHAFRKTSADEIIFGENSRLREILGSAFNSSKALKSIVLPKTLERLDSGTFAECSQLESVRFLGTPTRINLTNTDGVSIPPFQNCPKLKDIYVPWLEGEVEGAPWGATNATVHYSEWSATEGLEYAARPYANYSMCIGIGTATATDIVIDSQYEGYAVGRIENSAFDGCTHITSVALPSTVKAIGYYAFRNCTGLTSITLPANINRIEEDSFVGCTSLTDIYVSWAEGEIPWAPWGATNATIHYNS